MHWKSECRVLRQQLLSRICMEDIHAITSSVQNDDNIKQILFDLLLDEDDRVSYQAAWVMTHYSLDDNKWLYQKQDELIDEAMSCLHFGKLRLILTLLYKQPLKVPLRVDFLNFCFDGFIDVKFPVAVQASCLKLTYELCRQTPELLQELKVTLETMENKLTPAMSATRKNILKAMTKKKSLQVY